MEKHTGILNEHTETLEKHTGILNEHTETLEKHTGILNEHTERLDRIEQTMVTKQNHQQVMNALDKLLKLSNKNNEETSAMIYNLQRVADKVEKHEKDIGQIKTTLELGQMIRG